MALVSNVEPANAASASAIDGIEGFKKGPVGISSVSSLGVDAFALPLRATARAHSAATCDQSGCKIPWGASGLDILYVFLSPGSQCASSFLPLPEAW